MSLVGRLLFRAFPNDRWLGFSHERCGRLLGFAGCGMSGHLTSVRLVALDFETAVSMDHAIEIGCAEIIGGRLTGKVFHQLVRPLVPINPFTEAVHGISEKKVALMPTFAQVADTFLNFIGDAGIVAHGEHVERTILAKELARIGRQPLDPRRFICTLALARRSGLFHATGCATSAATCTSAANFAPWPPRRRRGCQNGGHGLSSFDRAGVAPDRVTSLQDAAHRDTQRTDCRCG